MKRRMRRGGFNKFLVRCCLFFSSLCLHLNLYAPSAPPSPQIQDVDYDLIEGREKMQELCVAARCTTTLCSLDARGRYNDGARLWSLISALWGNGGSRPRAARRNVCASVWAGGARRRQMDT